MRQFLRRFLVSLSTILLIAVIAFWIYAGTTRVLWRSLTVSTDPVAASGNTIYIAPASGRLRVTFSFERYDKRQRDVMLYKSSVAPHYGFAPEEGFAEFIHDDLEKTFADARTGFMLRRMPMFGTLGHYYALSIPFWFLALLTGFLPTRALFLFIRHRKRLLRGRCSKCGYDLRESPDRCPECGNDRVGIALSGVIHGNVLAAIAAMALLGVAAASFHLYVRNAAEAYSGEAERVRTRYALQLAVEDGDISKVRALLDAGVDPNGTDSFHRTALHVAATVRPPSGLAIANLLLSRGADVHRRDHSGYTALHYSAEMDADDMAQLLLSHGADPLAIDNTGNTPEHLTYPSMRELRSLLRNAAVKAAATRPATLPLRK